MAPEAGFAPASPRLTAECITVMLPWNGAPARNRTEPCALRKHCTTIMLRRRSWWPELHRRRSVYKADARLSELHQHGADSRDRTDPGQLGRLTPHPEVPAWSGRRELHPLGNPGKVPPRYEAPAKQIVRVAGVAPASHGPKPRTWLLGYTRKWRRAPETIGILVGR